LQVIKDKREPRVLKVTKARKATKVIKESKDSAERLVAKALQDQRGPRF